MASKLVHILDNQTDLLVAVLDPESETNGYWSAEHVDSSTNIETFDFIASGKSKSSPYLIGENRAVIAGDEPGTWKEFIIWHTHRGHGEVEVKCNGSYTEIAKDKVILPLVQENMRARDCLEFGLSDSDWLPGIVEGSAVRKITIGETVDPYQYLLRVAGAFDMKLRFRVVVKGNRVVARYVDLLYNIGNNLGKEILLGKDLIGVQRDELTDEIVTAMVVQGPERDDGTKLTITVEDEDARQRWGRGRHKWGYHQVESDNKAMEETELAIYGRTALNKKINSVIRYTADAVSLEHIFGLSHERTLKGDQVRIKDTSFNPPLYLQAKVVEIRRNPANAKSKRYVLGDFVEYTEEALMANFRKLQADLNKKLEESEVIDILDGYDPIVKSAIPPSNPKLNLLWLDTSVFPNALYRWDGGQWIKSTPTNPGDIGAETPDGAQGKVEIMQLRMEINNADNTKRELGVSVQKMNDIVHLQGNPVLNTLATANNLLISTNTLFANEVNAAIADNLLTQTEYNAIDTRRVNFRSAIDGVIRELRNAVTEAIRVSANEVMVYAEKKISKGSNLPADPQELDLWVDSTVTPPIWRQFRSGVWTNLSRTNISDLQGTIAETQIGTDVIKAPMIAANAVTAKHIATNIITSNMISTAGLDAGVITFGTMTGITAEVGNAGMSASGILGTAIRFWAGATFANRATAVFRVQHDGKLFASNVDISGGNLSGTSAKFGGANNMFGIVSVLDSLGEITAELNGEYGGFAQLNVGNLTAPNKLEFADFRNEPLYLYVLSDVYSGYTGNDNNGGTSTADALKTIGEAVRRIPRSFVGNVIIKLAPNQVFRENIFIAGYMGSGNIKITSDSGRNPIYGDVTLKQNLVSIHVDRLHVNCNQSYAGFSISQGQVVLMDVYVNGASGGTQYGIVVNGGGSCEVYDSEIYNVTTGIRAAANGAVMINDCQGYASNIGAHAYSGGRVGGGGTCVTGENLNTATGLGGTVSGAFSFPVSNPGPSPTPKETVVAWQSRPDSGTYNTELGRWETTGTHTDKVTQGSYGGTGPYVGSWFYGDIVETTLTGKTIKSMTLEVTRFPIGSYERLAITIRPHLSSSRPAGNVVVQTPSVTTYLDVGETKTITLPSSFYSGFQNGSYEGLSINGSNYVGMSRGTWLEVMYI